MSAELERYDHGAVVPITGGTPVPALPPASDTDGWIRVVTDVAHLAQQIANTDFVPDAMRGKPAAVTAAILAGREMGVGPMTALQHIHVIKGKPGQSAHLMRALVLAAGHEVDYVETTDSRAVIRGRRAGETDWTVVEFTADQAKRARIDLGGYPADKLVARATARLCRRKFADVISGLAYSVEELQDGDAQLIESGDAPPAVEAAATPQRTAQRKPAQRRTPKASAQPGAGGAAAPAHVPPGPPLPGEDGYDEPPATSAPAKTEAPADEPQTADQGAKSTTAQNRMMHALFREAEVTERDERLKVTGLLLGRALDTSAGLSMEDASVVIDALSALKDSGHDGGLAGAVTDLLNEDSLRDGEQDDADDPARADQ